MSQAKVDRYKEEKRNRQQIMKKEKRQWMLTKIAGGILAALVVVWAGFSVFSTIRGTSDAGADNTPVEVTEYTLDATALSDYLSSLSAD